MPTNNKRKLKLLTLVRILQNETDPQRGLSMPQIISRLAEEGISAERKAIYRDFDALREMGFDIQTLSKRPVEYVLVRSSLSFDDIMMLVDIVQSSRFITDRKSNQLVKSLKELLSDRERKQLGQRVHVPGRLKSQSESVFHNVDAIHGAMQDKRKIRFLYCSYGTDFKRKPRHDGRRYEMTPVRVVYANDNYYLAAYDDADEKVKTYRIDRMELLHAINAPATRNEIIATYDFADFANQSFGMFHGESAGVTLRVERRMVDVIVDRFGSNIDVLASSEDAADVHVNVIVSPQFFGWLAGLDGAVSIHAPARVASEYREWLEALVQKERTGL